jgi:hypothetical protein
MTTSHRDRERPHASRVVSLAIGMVSMMLASTVAQTPRSPELDQILQRAAAHVEQQARAMSDIVMQEDYLQVAKGTVRGHDLPDVMTRKTRADLVVLLDVGAPGTWAPFRDVYEVDGKPVKDRSEHVSQLVAKIASGSPRDAVAIHDESARFNLNAFGVDIDRTVNTPLTTLMFLRTANQPRSSFHLGSVERIDGVTCRIVEFSEESRPSLIESVAGSSARGRFWIEPASGHVLRSELRAEAAITRDWTRFVRATITVRYAEEHALNAWVPTAMDEQYELNASDEVITGHAAYSNYRRFGVSTAESAR